LPVEFLYPVRSEKTYDILPYTLQRASQSPLLVQRAERYFLAEFRINLRQTLPEHVTKLSKIRCARIRQSLYLVNKGAKRFIRTLHLIFLDNELRFPGQKLFDHDHSLNDFELAMFTYLILFPIESQLLLIPALVIVSTTTP